MKEVRQATIPVSTMSTSVQIFLFLIIILLVVGPSSSEGKIVQSQSSVQELVFSKVSIANKDELELRIEKRQELLFKPETNIPRSLGTKHERKLKENCKERERMQIQDRMQTNEVGQYHLDSKRQAYLNLKLAVQPQIDAKVAARTKHKKHVRMLGQNNLKIRQKNQIRMTVRKHERQNDENDVFSLWRRGHGQSSKRYKSESSHQKSKLQPNNASTPILRGSNLQGSDVSSPTIRKNKFVQYLTETMSKTPGSRKNPKVEDSSTQLTSGYAEKPQGVRSTSVYYPVSQQPRWQSTHEAGQDKSKDAPRPLSPPKSPEVNKMWDFINRHSKQWWSSEDSSQLTGDNEKPYGVGNNKQPIDSRPSGRSASNAYPNAKTYSSPSKRKSSPTLLPQSPKMPQSARKRASESKGDKDVRHLIKRHKKGWESADEVPVKDVSPSSSDDDSLFEKNQGSNSSQSPALVRSFPQRPPPRSGKPLHHMTNRELNKQYDAFITRVKSDSFEGRGDDNG